MPLHSQLAWFTKPFAHQRTPGVQCRPDVSPDGIPRWWTGMVLFGADRPPAAAQIRKAARAPAWRIVTVRGPMGALCRGRAARRTAGAIARAFRRMGRALSRQRSRQSESRSGRREDSDRPVHRHPARLARRSRLRSRRWCRRRSRSFAANGTVSFRDEDARWLFDAFTASPIKRDIKISRATHLMHLEAMRYALYRESIAFLAGNDEASMRQLDAKRSQPVQQQTGGPFDEHPAGAKQIPGHVR